MTSKSLKNTVTVATISWKLETIEKLLQQMVIEALEWHLEIAILPLDISEMTSEWLDGAVCLFTSRTKDEFSAHCTQLLTEEKFVLPLKNIVGRYFHYNEHRQRIEAYFIIHIIANKIKAFSFLPEDLKGTRTREIKHI